MSPLRPCSSCARHVREHETICPFCGGALESVASSPSRSAWVRAGRAALFVAGTAAVASVGATTVGCGPKPGPVQKPYGAPPADPIFEV